MCLSTGKNLIKIQMYELDHIKVFVIKFVQGKCQFDEALNSRPIVRPG